MANYEVQWGENTYYETDIGNPYQPCMSLVTAMVEDNQPIPISPFLVTNLSDGYNTEETVDLELILRLKQLEAEFLEKQDFISQEIA
jgi:hypothetical protein